MALIGQRVIVPAAWSNRPEVVMVVGFLALPVLGWARKVVGCASFEKPYLALAAFGFDRDGIAQVDIAATDTSPIGLKFEILYLSDKGFANWQARMDSYSDSCGQWLTTPIHTSEAFSYGGTITVVFHHCGSSGSYCYNASLKQASGSGLDSRLQLTRSVSRVMVALFASVLLAWIGGVLWRRRSCSCINVGIGAIFGLQVGVTVFAVAVYEAAAGGFDETRADVGMAVVGGVLSVVVNGAVVAGLAGFGVLHLRLPKVWLALVLAGLSVAADLLGLYLLSGFGLLVCLAMGAGFFIAALVLGWRAGTAERAERETELHAAAWREDGSGDRLRDLLGRHAVFRGGIVVWAIFEALLGAVALFMFPDAATLIAYIFRFGLVALGFGVYFPRDSDPANEAYFALGTTEATEPAVAA